MVIVCDWQQFSDFYMFTFKCARTLTTTASGTRQAGAGVLCRAAKHKYGGGSFWHIFVFALHFFYLNIETSWSNCLTFPNITHIYSIQISETGTFLFMKPSTGKPRKADEVTLTYNFLIEQRMFPGYFQSYPRSLKVLGYSWLWQFSTGKYSVFDPSCSYSVLYYVRVERTLLVRRLTSQ